jgi:CDP-diacylglycerol---glycerol-3-phosphate 3-phosphatidyltransferase
MSLATQLLGATGDVVFLICFSAGALIPFATYLVLLLVGVVSLPPAKHKGAGRRLFGPLFIGFYYWLLGPLFRLANRSGLRPNHLTLASLVAAVPTGVAIATGHFALASVLLVFGSTLDLFDGQLARSKNLVTTGGAFLDSTVDRVSDGMIFGGCAVYFAGTPAMVAALLALIMSFTTSYARARGESLGVSGSEGLMQRADRLVILGLALALSPFFGHRAEGFIPHPSYAVARSALWLLAFLSTFTAATRVVWIMNKLGKIRRAHAISCPPLQTETTPTPLPTPGVVSVGPLSALDVATGAHARSADA